MERRSFIKGLAALPLYLATRDVAYGSPSQEIHVNLPAFRLTLKSGIDTRSYPVAIGRGYAGRPETPVGHGEVYEKRKQVIFRYGQAYPQYDVEKGDIIRWTNTFKPSGEPTGYLMPYDDMRGLGRGIHTDDGIRSRYVIHSTTDWFTVGTPASSGCLRLNIDDMLDLYSSVIPHRERGQISVPLTLSYDLIEVSGSLVTLHADVYGASDHLKELVSHGYPCTPALRNNIRRIRDDFDRAHDHILETLLQDYPRNFVPDDLKSRLHTTISLEELYS